MKMKKEDFVRMIGHKADSITAHVKNKILPISKQLQSSSSSSVTSSNDQCVSADKKKDRPEGDKNKAISHMKDIVKWVAAKSDKRGSPKVFYVRNRKTLKAVPNDDDDDDKVSMESPKISFRWDVESYSGFAVACSSSNDLAQNKLDQEMEFTSTRYGSWITTDSDFVVLEL